MSDFRVKYGLSYGEFGNFYARTDGLLGNSDATPDVTRGTLFWTAVANAAAITYLDGFLAGGVAGVEEGKVAKIIFLGTGTTLTDGAQFNLKDGVNWQPEIGDYWEGIHANSAWYETGRSSNNAKVSSVTSTNLTAVSALDVGNIAVLRCTAQASSLMTVNALLNGVDGQRVAIAAINSQVTLNTNSAGLSDGFITTSSGGSAFVIQGSSVADFVRVTMGSTAKWFELRDQS